jgi:hypothetical protein
MESEGAGPILLAENHRKEDAARKSADSNFSKGNLSNRKPGQNVAAASLVVCTLLKMTARNVLSPLSASNLISPA